MTVAAEDRVGLALALAPNHRHVTGQFLMAVNAGIKRVAALESYGHDIALRVVVCTLSPLIDADAANDHTNENEISESLRRARLNSDWTF
jgi:hypothetical protein